MVKPLNKASGVTSGTTLAGGGKLTPEQSDKFITTVVENSTFLKKVQHYKMASHERYIEMLNIGKRMLRKAGEGEEPASSASISTARRKLSTVEIILPIDISYSFLEDNIEKTKAEQTILDAIAKQFANDTEDLGWNGDDTKSDEFIKINNGWLALSRADSKTNKVDLTAVTDSPMKIMKAMLDAMPEKFKTKDIEFVCSSEFKDAYIEELTSRNTALGDKALTEAADIRYKGYLLNPRPYLSMYDIMLANPLNIAYGVQRDISIEFVKNPRKRMIEYTITARTDYEYAVAEAIVVTTGTPTSGTVESSEEPVVS